jgi:hypothetical protein
MIKVVIVPYTSYTLAMLQLTMALTLRPATCAVRSK